MPTKCQKLEWEKCLDALRGMADLQHRPSITAALLWLGSQRQQFPDDPPTCIIAEPDGGIIVERRVTTTWHEHVYEMTFYDDGSREQTEYCDGRIVKMIVNRS